MTPARVVFLLSLLLGLQPVTTDLYLPALPGITQELGVQMSQAQFTLSALLLAFGVSQLMWGPLSDRWGRRPILLWGLAIYILTGMGGALATSMMQLIFWRTLQGAALGAVVMCGRAIVRDLYQPEHGARTMSKALTGLGFIACISPPIGGLISEMWSWRIALMVVALFGVFTLVIVAWWFPESSKRQNRHALRPAFQLRTWRSIVGHPTFIAFSAVTVGSFAGLFAFLTSSSFIFIQHLGMTRWQYGGLLFSTSFVYLLGTLVCRQLLKRFDVHRTVAIGGTLSLLGGCTTALSAWIGWHSVPALIGPYYLYALAHGIHQPCGQSGAVGPFPRAAGAASALGGFLMMSVAFLTGLWLSAHTGDRLYPMVDALAFWSVITALSAWFLVFPRRVIRD